MSGCIIGLLSALLVLKLAQLAFFGRRCGYRRHGGHGHGGWGGWGHRHRRGLDRNAMARAMGEVFKRRVRIHPDQEDIVDHALADVRAALQEAAASLGETRGSIADAFRGEQVDEAALSAALARQDEAVQDLRRELISAMKQVHAVLDPDQRKRAADWLGKAVPTTWV